MSIFMDLIQHITTLLEFISVKYDEKVFKEALQECLKGMKKINNALKNATSVGEKQHLEASLRSIRSLRQQIKTTQKKGAGLKIRKETATKRVHWDDSISAFCNRIRTGVITNMKHKDPKTFLDDCKTLCKRRIQNSLKKDEAVKVNAVFCGEFEIVHGEKILKEYKYFTTSNAAIFKDTDFGAWFEKNISMPVLKKLEEFRERDSGWRLITVINLGLNINKYTPQLGSSYIELPKQIRLKKACINVKNDDNACFAWAVVSALYPAEKDPHRIYKYPHYSKVLKLKGIQFPMTIKQIPIFEKQNNISINVYILKKTRKDLDTLPTYLTSNKQDKHVNLLLVQDYYEVDDECRSQGPIKYHYIWIKDLSRLLSKQLSKHDGKKYFCDRCLHYFRTEDKLTNHIEDCKKINDTAIKLPEIGKNILKFKNHKNKEKAPFIVYADLESILKPIYDTRKFQEHIPAAVGFYLKCSYDDSISFYRSYRGEDCMQWFANEMNNLAEDVEPVFMCPFDIHMTTEQEAEFRASTHCHICSQLFKPNERKVRDHNHLIPDNNYRGAAHEGCNINYQDTHTIPVVFHNLSGYDAHFIINDIANRMDGTIDLLPINKEKYISFTKKINGKTVQFRFVDSFRFMASSLDKLSSYLIEFPNLKHQFSELAEEELKLLQKKGIMPYDYFNSFGRFNETCLPPIESFYNKLEDKPCPRRIYRRAHEVWNKFNCSNLGNYVDLYMKTDILLLADVFEQFRASCLKTYELDPAHYFTLPGFTWDAMLKHTKQELELLTEQDMFLFVEKGIRGGLSQICSKRRAHANNKYMKNYNPAIPEKYLMYFDINNQYGYAMSQFLPYGGFKWVGTNIDITSIPDDSRIGYILEVDLDYPHHIHDRHKDLPFCPEHINPKTMKTPLKPKEITKLMATLYKKEKYVLHFRNLKQALENGLVFRKIHRVLEFKQSPWLKSYIDLNTKLRKASKNDFEKNLFKLMNNAVFGKTMENVRKRVDIKLRTKWDGRYGVEKLISRPEFKTCTVFNENLAAIEMKKMQVYFNKPIYVGMSILDIAKTTIYDFHYNYMLIRFGENCAAAYTDTDSLVYEIITQDPYEIIRQDCHTHFDTSDYSPNNVYNIPQVNKKVLGMMKDENNGIPMTDYVGLRSKLYTTKVLSCDDKIKQLREKLKHEEYEDDEIINIIRNYGVTKKAKGVRKYVVNTKITFEDYVECLENFEHKTTSQNIILSDKHNVYSVSQDKIALNPVDDKRYLIPGSYETLPWGHYAIPTLAEPSIAPIDTDETMVVIND